jgi:DNA-binding response OmpR family regulator
MAKKVLIVEDDEFLRGLIAKELSYNNFDVLLAIDGDEGAKKIKEELPDLVVLDLLLPNKDGFEVLTESKSDPKTAGIPVIILSNLNQKEDVEKVMKLGAADFMVKAQFNLDEIVGKIKTALENPVPKP